MPLALEVKIGNLSMYLEKLKISDAMRCEKLAYCII